MKFSDKMKIEPGTPRDYKSGKINYNGVPYDSIPSPGKEHWLNNLQFRLKKVPSKLNRINGNKSK